MEQQLSKKKRGMLMKKCAAIVLSIVFTFLLSVSAKGASVCFYDDLENTCYQEKQDAVSFAGTLTTEEKAFTLFSQLVSNPNGERSFVPEGTELLWVCYGNGILLVNLSEEAENCAGNTNQQYFVNQIVKTAYSLEEIKSIILYVEGEESHLPEGTDFHTFDRI